MGTWGIFAACAVVGLCSAVQGSQIHEANGLTWMMMPDGQGKLQLAILTGPHLRQQKEVVLHENVTFMLYTRANSVEGARIFVDDAESLTSAGFDPQIPTKICIHGFGGHLNDDVIQGSRADYLELGAHNIIGVDWSVLCRPPLYNIAKINALLVGEYVANLVDFLVRETGAQLSDIHLIGHSLGGQVVGIAGYHVTGGKVSRVTALDPALPLFSNEDDKNRVDPSDAELVDVIHTDGNALGLWLPAGHVDFYPNGGKAPQPGCGVDLTGSCSHGRSVTWFVDTILLREGYPAVQCSSIQEAEAEQCSSNIHGVMGDNIGLTPPGIYHVSILPEKK